jgi:hypothetical protein
VSLKKAGFPVKHGSDAEAATRRTPLFGNDNSLLNFANHFEQIHEDFYQSEHTNFRIDVLERNVGPKRA